MIGCFAAHKMVAVRKAGLAARIGIRRLVALALGAAVGGFAIESATRKAVEGPSQQEHCQESNCDMKAAPHQA
jgi:hypothetical protein